LERLDLTNILNLINNTSTIDELEALRQKYLSKSGYFATAMKNLATLSIEEKKQVGKVLNEEKTAITDAISTKLEQLEYQIVEQKMLNEKIDLTIPSNIQQKGGLHPITSTIEQIMAVFGDLGYIFATETEIEDDWYNFTALNVPAHHPARQMHDTFYINKLDSYGNKKVLRTHTSNVQIRTMMKESANNNGNLVKPIKIIAPGKTYRSDSDATHSPMFHQAEGLYVDEAKNISVPLLKALLMNFVRKFFNNNDIDLRFRPSYFPFTSPSYEVDIRCDRSNNQLIIGKGNDWLEVLGCGIVHENVLKNCNIDSTKYKGLAFGVGIERLAMLKYNIKDLRAFFEGDIRWLNYYNFSPLIIPTVSGGLN
jgi:phenylalanyl-tRNA synthetase alpha chain